MTTLPSARLFQAATKLREARAEIAEAEADLKGTDAQPELGLLHEELSDLNWRTESLAMRRERDETRKGQHKGPLTPATDFPDYDPVALEAARALLTEEQEDVADQAASLPLAPTATDRDRAGAMRRGYEAAKGFFSRAAGSSGG